MDVRHSGYLETVFSKKKIKNTIRKCREALKGLDYDAIVVTGVSGLSIGATVAYLTGKQLIVVRKQEEKSHASQTVEGFPYDNFKYVILDDFVSEGNTIVKIAERLKSQSEYHLVTPIFVGLVQYYDGRKAFCNPDQIWEQAFHSRNRHNYDKFMSLV